MFSVCKLKFVAQQMCLRIVCIHLSLSPFWLKPLTRQDAFELLCSCLTSASLGGVILELRLAMATPWPSLACAWLLCLVVAVGPVLYLLLTRTGSHWSFALVAFTLFGPNVRQHLLYGSFALPDSQLVKPFSLLGMMKVI